MTTKQELEQLKKQFADLEAKIAQEEKQEIKTCEDAFNKLKPEWFIDNNGYIGSITDSGLYEHNQCNMTSEKEAKRMKALIQLRRNAEAMNEGVDGGYEFSIYITKSFTLDFVYPDSSAFTIFPIFHTEELAQQALTNFRPLFEDLYAE
jgi:hypothetical protein